MFYCFKFSAYISFFAKVLIEANVNISNGFNFYDVYQGCTQPNIVCTLHFCLKCKLHWVTCIVNLLCIQSSIVYTLHFDKHQKNEIHSLNDMLVIGIYVLFILVDRQHIYALT